MHGSVIDPRAFPNQDSPARLDIPVVLSQCFDAPYFLSEIAFGLQLGHFLPIVPNKSWNIESKRLALRSDSSGSDEDTGYG